jgi:cell wall-associated NlpC family hydrolase
MGYLGLPYFWGGNSPKGFDCSGFTKTIYRMNGIELPRDANMQALAGQPVELDSTYSHLQPGDLLFFGPRTERITHVAMYLGNRRFIHSDGMVRINSFSPKDDNYSEYRVRGLRLARRFLK